VVSAPLQDLGDETLDAATPSRERRIEEHESGPLFRPWRWLRLREARHESLVPIGVRLNRQSGDALGGGDDDCALGFLYVGVALKQGNETAGRPWVCAIPPADRNDIS
jgi:hypothetical protein